MNSRENYEKLLISLSKEAKIDLYFDPKLLSDYQLLYQINLLLVKLNAIPFSQEELEELLD